MTTDKIRGGDSPLHWYSRLAVVPNGNNERVVYVQRQKTWNVSGMKNILTDGIDKRTNELHDVTRTTRWRSRRADSSVSRKINFVSISSHVRAAFSSTRCRSAAAATYGYLNADYCRANERRDRMTD